MEMEFFREFWTTTLAIEVKDAVMVDNRVIMTKKSLTEEKVEQSKE